MWWLFVRLVRRPLRRFLLGAVGVAVPVAMLGSILLFVDDAVRSMTTVALAPVQVEMRALASSLDVDMNAAGAQISTVRGVQRVDRFASADVLVSAPGTAPTAVRLFAVDPGYFEHHPEVRLAEGSLQGGAALAQPLRETAGFGTTPTVTLMLDVPAPPPAPAPAANPDEEPAPDEPPPPPPWSLTLPVTGTADLRTATTWYAVPSGDAQGDVAVVPRALVIDYAVFEQSMLPELRRQAASDSSWAFDPGNTDLPRASVERHVGIDHASYPTDPAKAEIYSNTTRRVIERQAAGGVIVTDNAAEALLAAKQDATNAKILFFLLGFPGVLVGAALGLAAAGALAETERREQALLQLRGATNRQQVVLTSAQALVASLVGAALGLVAAALAVDAVTGRAVWEQLPADRLRVTIGLAVAVGLLTTVARLVPVVRRGRRVEVMTTRQLLEPDWNPFWRRARLDLVLIGVGALVLAVNVFAGGLKPTPIEGQTLALAFYVLLAPMALWLGVTLLIARLLLALLRRASRPDRLRPLRSWPGTALRWFGRRPARSVVAMVLCALAVAFGTTVTSFTATYTTARAADRASALGSDLRLAPPVNVADPPPPVAGVASTSPIRVLPARVGTDRKLISTVDLATYSSTVTVPERLLAGQGVSGLAADPSGVLINKELADGFSAAPGDSLPVTVFPDDPVRSRILNLHVVGVFRSVPPSEPPSELVMSTAGLGAVLPPPAPAAIPVPAPDFYLVKASPGTSTTAVAAEFRSQLPTWTVQTLATLVIPEQRALTSLNLRGLSRLESVAAGLVATIGVAILGAFLVLERRREAVVLRTVGAGTAQVVTAPGVEGAVAVLGGLLIGIPVGLGVGILTVRILLLFFTLPPPLLVVPAGALAALAAVVVLGSVVALTLALMRVSHQSAASVLRDI